MEESISLTDVNTDASKTEPKVGFEFSAPVQKVQKKSSKLTVSKYQAFFLTGFLYAFFHAMRTVWGYIKPYLMDQNPFYNHSKLGFLDLAFTIAYAIGLYVNGWLGDRINLKKFLMIGTLTTVVGLSLFGTLEGFVGIEKIGFDMIAFGFNGLGQSVGYPGCISIINNWFGSKKTGLIFGLWGMHINIGNILGQQIGRFVINNKWHWANALILTCVVASFNLMILMIYLKVHPKELNLNNDDDLNVSNHENSTVQMQGISFMKAWKIKYVPQYALAYLCINGVIYAILLWLPTYLVDNLRIEGDISSLLAAMEVGQLIGSVVLGLVSDKIKSRPIAITFGFFFSVVFLAITSITPPHVNKHVFLVFFFLTGFGLGGPGSLISGAVSSDLGKTLMETQNINAISTITGIMKGCGAAGAAATQLLIANFTSITFPFFAGLCTVGGLLIAPLAMEDLRSKIKTPYLPTKKNDDIKILPK